MFDLTLYLVTDRTGKTNDEFFETVKQACLGGVTLVQLREKDASALEYIQLAAEVKLITDSFGIPLIIDDRADVALAVNAAGVHVGQQDMPVHLARKLLGPDKIVGATAKTVEQARKAKAEGADYLGVGAIYPTTTKVVTVITEVSTLNEIAAQTQLPVVAIGGLNASNIHVLYNSAAAGAAVVTAIMNSTEPIETARKLKEIITQNFKEAQSCHLQEV
jgi:thiamine-phosphate pyrophosphorylase